MQVDEKRIFVTADEHYHDPAVFGLLRQTKFENLDDMNEQLIKIHNDIVSASDFVIHVGDFSTSKDYRKIREIVEQLNGVHHLVIGNHDVLTVHEYCDSIGFMDVYTKLNLNIDYMFAHDPCFVCVHPDHRWCVGHIHTLFRSYNNVFNAGVDVNNFKPIRFDDMRRVLDVNIELSTFGLPNVGQLPHRKVSKDNINDFDKLT